MWVDIPQDCRPGRFDGEVSNDVLCIPSPLVAPLFPLLV